MIVHSTVSGKQELQLTLNAGQSIVFTPTLTGSLEGCGFTSAIEWISGGLGEGAYALEPSNDVYTFLPGAHEGTEDAVIRVVFASEEDPAVTVSVRVTVHPQPQTNRQDAGDSGTETT